MEVDLCQEECPTCHILYWIPRRHQERLIRSKESFYCPNGHSQCYPGKTDAQKLKEQEIKVEKLKDDLWEKTCEINRLTKNIQRISKKKVKKKKVKKKK